MTPDYITAKRKAADLIIPEDLAVLRKMVQDYDGPKLVIEGIADVCAGFSWHNDRDKLEEVANRL